MLHQFGDATLNLPHHRYHTGSHGVEEGHRQVFKIGHQEDRLGALQELLKLVGWHKPAEVDAIGEAGLMQELLAGGAFGGVAD
jgi:hypothetical protein